MVLNDDESGLGIFDALRKRGFWFFFPSVVLVVFALLTSFDFALPFFYGREQPGLDLNVAGDLGINLLVGLLTGGFAWKYNGKPWINRPNTIKLDLDK